MFYDNRHGALHWGIQFIKSVTWRNVNEIMALYTIYYSLQFQKILFTLLRLDATRPCLALASNSSCVSFSCVFFVRFRWLKYRLHASGNK